jgi:sugar lactone lactonase YvrE
MVENEFEAGIGSGTANGVAFVPAKDIVFIADTLPETIEPIRMPTPSVTTRNAEAIIFRRRAQLNKSCTC